MKKKVLGACAAAVGVLLLIAAAVAVWILQKPETRFLVTMQQALREKGLLGEFWERREQGQLLQCLLVIRILIHIFVENLTVGRRLE